MFRINPTPEGGRRAVGETPWGNFEVLWNKDGELLSQSMRVLDPTNPAACGCSKAQEVVGHRTLAQKLGGAVSLARAEVLISHASDKTIESRKATCLACPKYDFGVCLDCGCYLAAKVVDSKAKCPLAKW